MSRRMKRHGVKSATGFAILFLVYLSRFVPFARARGFLYDRICTPFLRWRQIEVVARTRGGARILCRSTDLIQRYILYYGVWEPNLTAFIRKALKPGDGFIDVGANIGYFSLWASSLVGPNGNVVAIEASPAIFSLLNENLALNASENVRPVNLAASNESGKVTVYSAPDSNIGRTTLLASMGFARECEIRMAPLVDILTPDEISNARLIKIDVEGAELPVLENILENIGAFHDDIIIVVEMTPPASGEANHGTQANTMVQRFLALGFKAWVLENDYSRGSYLENGPPLAPRRLDGIIVAQSDIIFARQEDLFVSLPERPSTGA